MGIIRIIYGLFCSCNADIWMAFKMLFSPKLLLLISIELHGIDHVVWLINPSRTIDSS